jgi:hypothetical protein
MDLSSEGSIAGAVMVDGHGAGGAVRAALGRLRRRWLGVRRTRALLITALVALAAVAALVAADLAYHLPRKPRIELWAAAVLSVLVLGGILLRRSRRSLPDATAALALEARYPELRGLALAAVASAPGGRAASEEEALLRQALLAEADRQVAALDAGGAVDARALRAPARALLAMLAAMAAAMVIAPERAWHELRRALTPWSVVPPSNAEIAAQERADAVERQARELAEQSALAAAAAAAPIRFEVAPGAAEVRRGGSLAVSCALSRVTETPQLRVRLSNGSWRSLAMTPVPDDALRFTAVIADLSDDSAYQVAMGTSVSDAFPITVFDQIEVSDLRVACDAPAYAKLPTTTRAGGDIEGLIGATAHVQLTATGALGAVQLVADDGKSLPVRIDGATATADVPITADGGYRLSAVDAHHRAVTGLARHYAIHALADHPPTISLMYPAIDTIVHPLEDVAIAARVADDVGLKEVRLCSTYALGDAQVERRSCAVDGRPLRELLATFSFDLKHRQGVHVGDAIVFHLEVEDTHGQSATTDPFVLTVRGYESMVKYANGNKHGANGQTGADYTTLLGALHDLGARRAELTPEQFAAECEHIADVYTENQIAH